MILDNIVEAIFSDWFSGDTNHHAAYTGLFMCLPAYGQRIVLYTLIRLLSRRFPNAASDEDTLGGCAALIVYLTESSRSLRSALVDWLTDNSGGAVQASIGIIRAVIATLAIQNGTLGESLNDNILTLNRTLEGRF